jgi:hypothetical protein
MVHVRDAAGYWKPFVNASQCLDDARRARSAGNKDARIMNSNHRGAMNAITLRLSRVTTVLVMPVDESAVNTAKWRSAQP